MISLGSKEQKISEEQASSDVFLFFFGRDMKLEKATDSLGGCSRDGDSRAVVAGDYIGKRQCEKGKAPFDLAQRLGTEFQRVVFYKVRPWLIGAVGKIDRFGKYFRQILGREEGIETIGESCAVADQKILGAADHRIAVRSETDELYVAPDSDVRRIFRVIHGELIIFGSLIKSFG